MTSRSATKMTVRAKRNQFPEGVGTGTPLDVTVPTDENLESEQLKGEKYVDSRVLL